MPSNNMNNQNGFEIKIFRGISPLMNVNIEPAGPTYHQYEYNRLHGVDNEILSDSNSDSSKERGPKDINIEEDLPFLKSLDPAKWKEQDHYKVLGLQNYRLKATDDDIKRTYKQLVLRHHPDKRCARGEKVSERDDYFANIVKAYETLGDPIKRKSYDSVDPTFDDSVPGEKLSNKSRFYDIFGPVFERNSRWSVDENVPQLGGPEDSWEKIELFYDYWYNFESWREFSYLDEEDKEKGEDRDERKWIDRQNKAERLVKKKEESSRIRRLVDNAYKLDPRIAAYKAAERDKKLAVKKAKQEAMRKKLLEEQEKEERIKEEERIRKEKEEAELKERLAIEKKQRESTKKALVKVRKSMRTMCKEADYFITEERDRVPAMMDVETLCDGLQLLQLRDLVARVTTTKTDSIESRKIIKQTVEDLRSGKLENVNLTNNLLGGNSSTCSTPVSSSSTSPKSNGTAPPERSPEWTPDELQLLIKAVNLFPAGTAKRWDVVAQYLSQHGPNTTMRPPKEVLCKAKELQNTDTSQMMRDAANKAAVDKVAATEKKGEAAVANAEASQRLETPQEMLGLNLAPWTKEEQSLLEQALKTYPTTEKDRWEKVASCIPQRNKKDCMRRYKELAEMIKAKKAAMKAAGVKK